MNEQLRCEVLFIIPECELPGRGDLDPSLRIKIMGSSNVVEHCLDLRPANSYCAIMLMLDFF